MHVDVGWCMLTLVVSVGWCQRDAESILQRELKTHPNQSDVKQVGLSRSQLLSVAFIVMATLDAIGTLCDGLHRRLMSSC